MRERSVEGVSDMGIVQHVVGALPYSAMTHEPELPEGAQRVRDRGLRETEQAHNVADAELLGRESTRDP